MISEIADGMEPVNPVRKCCPLRRRILFIRQVIHDPFDPIFAMPTPQLFEFRFGEAVFQKRKAKVVERAEVDQEKAKAKLANPSATGATDDATMTGQDDRAVWLKLSGEGD